MKKTTTKCLAYLFIIAGFIAFIFSFIIMVEKLHVAADPSYVPPCTLNPFVSCTKVMASPQAAIFGFPNPLLGIAGFPILITIGFALLAGATFKRWFWRGIQTGLSLATILVYWFFYQAVFNIQSLCLYCMAVWIVTIPMFLYATAYHLQEGYLTSRPIILTRSWKALFLFLMYGVIAVSILVKFWSYWSGLIA